MSAVLTGLDIVDLAAHDFDAACTSRIHGEYGTGPAVYMVWTRIECTGGSCADIPRSGLACEGCMDWSLTYPGASVCFCGSFRVTPYRLCIDHYERLRSP